MAVLIERLQDYTEGKGDMAIMLEMGAWLF